MHVHLAQTTVTRAFCIGMLTYARCLAIIRGMLTYARYLAIIRGMLTYKRYLAIDRGMLTYARCLAFVRWMRTSKCLAIIRVKRTFTRCLAIIRCMRTARDVSSSFGACEPARDFSPLQKYLKNCVSIIFTHISSSNRQHYLRDAHNPFPAFGTNLLFLEDWGKCDRFDEILL